MNWGAVVLLSFIVLGCVIHVTDTYLIRYVPYAALKYERARFNFLVQHLENLVSKLEQKLRLFHHEETLFVVQQSEQKSLVGKDRLTGEFTVAFVGV